MESQAFGKEKVIFLVITPFVIINYGITLSLILPDISLMRCLNVQIIMVR